MRMITGTITLFLLLMAGVAAAAPGLARNEVAVPGEIPGVYTLLLAGASYNNDPERVAILDLEGDAYTFQPVMPAYRYTKVPGLPAAAALIQAEKYLALHCAYNGYRLKSLALPDGKIVGYELIPDLPAALCEYGNVVTVAYGVGDDGVIKVYTHLVMPTSNDSFSGDGMGRGR